MTFRETLDKHLRAIQERDLASLRETLPAESLVLVMSDGRLVRSVAEFVKLHRGWFAMKTWTLQTRIVEIFETAEQGAVVLYLDYRDQTADGQAIQESSYLTLVFARQNGQWVMVQDQNTPIKKK